MRSYGQYCAVAKSLDLIGDRWNLLIVRELLLRGPSRYTDLQHGLPGIATNLLADRLRDLEQAGLVSRAEAPAPVAATVFALTPRGEELEPVLRELVRWGAPLMAEPPGDDAFCPHWLSYPAQLFLTDRSPTRRPVSVELRTGDEPLTIEARGGDVRTHAGPAENPDLVLSGSPHLVVGALTGMLELDEAATRGLAYEGDPRVLRRLRRP